MQVSCPLGSQQPKVIDHILGPLKLETKEGNDFGSCRSVDFMFFVASDFFVCVCMEFLEDIPKKTSEGPLWGGSLLVPSVPRAVMAPSARPVRDGLASRGALEFGSGFLFGRPANRRVRVFTGGIKIIPWFFGARWFSAIYGMGVFFWGAPPKVVKWGSFGNPPLKPHNRYPETNTHPCMNPSPLFFKHRQSSAEEQEWRISAPKSPRDE